jgi:hypothetical protein
LFQLLYHSHRLSLLSLHFQEDQDQEEGYGTDRNVASLVSAPESRIFHSIISRSGTYIQKHHRQLTFWVKAPPNTGPTQTLIPNTLTTIPIYNGRFSNTTLFVIILRAPCKRPAAPQPAIARPKMNTADLGAVAQMIDPTSHLSVRVFGPSIYGAYLQIMPHRPNTSFSHCRACIFCRRMVGEQSWS